MKDGIISLASAEDYRGLTLLNYRAGDGAPFPIDPEICAVVEDYRNRDFIADFALPYVPVGSMSFKYYNYPLKESFQNIKTEVGRKGKPKVVEFTGTETTDGCVNHAIDDDIPYDDIEDAPDGHNPVDRASLKLMDIILTRREVDVASIIQDSANYGSGYYASLEAGDKFSNASANPLDKMLTALDIPIIRPNRVFFGQTGWRYFRTHPKIAKAVLGNGGDSFAATKEQIAQLLEVDQVHVGRALYDTAKKGQTESLATAWGNHVSLLYIDERADTNGGITFGFTARKPYEGSDRWGGRKDDDSIGAKGGVKVRVGESRKEVIVAKKVGYLLRDVV